MEGNMDAVELREYQKIVNSVPEVRCCDCPFCTPMKKRPQGGWCQPPNMSRVRMSNIERKYCCFTYARLVLKMPV